MNVKKILIVLILVFLIGCSNQIEEGIMANPHERTEFLMGTIVTIKIYDEEKEQVLDTAFERIETLANLITTEEAESEITKINTNSGENPVIVSNEVIDLIKEGKKFSEQALGSYDITIGPLTSLWRIGFDDARKPTQSEIDAILPLIDYQKVKIDETNQSVFLPMKDMKLDLGSIAKGYIADEVLQVLKQHQVTTAILNLGGNIYVHGKHPSGSNWTVGVQNPFAGRGEIIGKLPATNKSIVTTGIYERYLEVDGTKYHHILNPNDGYPYRNQLAGVSIISDKSTDGDALSTIAFSKGLQQGFEFIERLDGIEAIFVSREKQVYVTSGLTKDFELENENLKMGEELDS